MNHDQVALADPDDEADIKQEKAPQPQAQARGKQQLSPQKPKVQYASCCIAVHGAERNLYVLPRALPGGRCNEDGTPVRAGMAEVYQELNKLLVPDVISRSQVTMSRSIIILPSSSQDTLLSTGIASAPLSLRVSLSCHPSS